MNNEGRKGHTWSGQELPIWLPLPTLSKTAAFRARTSTFTRRRVYRADVLTQLALLKRVTSCAARALPGATIAGARRLTGHRSTLASAGWL